MEKKEKGKKKSKEISALWFSFTPYTSTLCRCIQNLKTLTLLGAEKSVTKNFIGENEKMTNKGNNKHEDAVPEKSLTKNNIGEKEKWTNKGNCSVMGCRANPGFNPQGTTNLTMHFY